MTVVNSEVNGEDNTNGLVADILSRDSDRVWSSSSAIVRLRDPRALDVLSSMIPEITAATADLDLGGAFYPNKERVQFAIHKLEYYRDRAGCLCRLYLYSKYPFYNPKQEEDDGNVTILSTDTAAWTYSCQCSVCGALYSVEEGESHYMWWDWKAL